MMTYPQHARDDYTPKFRLILISGVSHYQQVVGDMSSLSWAIFIGGRILEADKLDHPEFSGFDIQDITQEGSPVVYRS